MAAQLALWDLRAEQVMDRVFAGVDAPPPALPPAADPAPPVRHGHRRLVLAGLGLGLLVGALVHLWQNQQRVQSDLQQERQWRMLERLRSLDHPATAEPTAPAVLTPPPPLPSPPIARPQRRPVRPLTLSRHREVEPTRRTGPPPIRVALPPPAPPRLPPPVVPTPLPELLGVVQTAGQRDSAIFSTTAGPLSVSPGDGIGGTGWRLLAVTADGVEIGQGSVRRTLSLGR